MGLVLEFEETSDLTVPKFVCDWCGEEITDVKLGLVSWVPTLEHGPIDFRTTHKGYCDRNTEQAACTHLATMELSHFLGYLLHNVGREAVARIVGGKRIFGEEAS
ncbi:MAG: hypothetical protein M3P49_02155 [Actinomycetota bacterium]|nr:hypothetical protein [Actinomycetota bacterium]